MDEKIEKFNELIQNNKDSYNNICLLWKNYIKFKLKNFEQELDNAISKLSNINNIIHNDVSLDAVCSLIILSQIQCNNVIND